MREKELVYDDESGEMMTREEYQKKQKDQEGKEMTAINEYDDEYDDEDEDYDEEEQEGQNPATQD